MTTVIDHTEASNVLDDDRVDHALAAIARTPIGPARESQIEEFLREFQEVIAKVARGMCHRYGLNGGDLDDVRSLAMEATLVGLRALGQPGVEPIRIFHVWLGLKVRTRVRIMTEQAAHTGVSGQTSKIRRERAIRLRVQQRETELGRYLTTDEQSRLVGEYNAEVMRSRVDAARQGALANVADLVEISQVGIEDYDAPTTDVNDVVVAPFEMVGAIRETVARCDAEDRDSRERGHAGRLGRIVRALYEPYLVDGESARRSVPEIVLVTGENRETVRRHVTRADEIMREVMATVYGIEGAA